MLIIMSQIELNENSVLDLLMRYADAGYRTGTVSIKDGAVIHKWFRILKKTEKDESVEPKELYKKILALIENFNSKKAYGLDDAAVLDKLFEFVNLNFLTQHEKIVEM